MIRPSHAVPLAAVLASAPAAAGPLNPWGAHVGEGVFALTPFLYVDQAPAVYPYLYAQYGVTDAFEVLLGAGGTVASASSFDAVEITPRYFLAESTAVGVRAEWVPGDAGVRVGPEVHGVYSLGPIELTANVAWSPYVGAGGFGAGGLGAMVAPEWYFTDASSIFVEVNPEYDLTEGVADRFYLEVVPGVSTAIAETHYFAFGVAVPVTGFDPTRIYGGMWYSIAFGGA